MSTLSKHAAAYAAIVSGVFPCFECDHPGPHEDNGASGSAKAFSCAGCGMVVDADTVFEQVMSRREAKP